VQAETYPGEATASDARPGHAGDSAVLDNKHVKKSYARWAPIYDLVFALVLRPGRKAAGHARDAGVAQDDRTHFRVVQGEMELVPVGVGVPSGIGGRVPLGVPHQRERLSRRAESRGRRARRGWTR